MGEDERNGQVVGCWPPGGRRADRGVDNIGDRRENRGVDNIGDQWADRGVDRLNIGGRTGL